MSREGARYSYTAGSRPEGVATYDDDTKLHSHHDTDPARGQNSAFDLVRVHKFGHLDKDTASETPMAERPSFRAMVAFAATELRAIHAADELVEPANDDSWLDIPDAKAEQASPFRVLDADEFAGTLAPREWVIKGLIPDGAEFVMIFGSSGDGKSFFASDALTDVHLGRPACGGRKTKKCSVIRIVAEGAQDDKFRCHAIAAAKGVAIKELPRVIPCAPDLSDERVAAAVTKEIVAKGGCKILLVDNLMSTNTLDENSSEMGLYIRNLKQIGRVIGCSVWCIHHAGKSADKGSRGFSGLKGAADVEIQVSRGGDDCRVVTLTKAKGSLDGTSLAFRLKPVTLGRDTDGDEYGSCTVEYVDDMPVAAKKLPKADSEARRVYDVMMAEIAAGQGEAPEDKIIAAVAATKREPAPGETDKRKSRATQEVARLVTQGFAMRDGRVLKTSRLVKGGKADADDF